MTTLRQIERHWTAKQFDRLLADMLAGRPESGLGGRLRVIPAAAAATMIRLDELAQSHVRLYPRMVRTLVHTQDADGGWGDPMTTALCLRALLLGEGNGMSIERGLAYLANLQKGSGAWPVVPIRRTDADTTTTAFVLYQLADQPAFRRSARVDDAMNWLEAQSAIIDRDLHPLLDRARARCRLRPVEQPALVWS